MPKPQRQVNTSLLEIPGDPPTFLDTHALNPDTTPRTEIGHYLNENAQAEDRELFEDIMPFVSAH
jgi:hypothetical protein